MPILQLLRLPGAFTAAADVLAGYLLVRFSGAGRGQPTLLAYLVLASMCLYMAGMAWNDVFDIEEDRLQRPERPIPSGLVSLTTGFVVAALLSVVGLMLAMMAGMQSFLIASFLLAAILLYDGGGKRLEVVGPLLMGSCRGLNLLLGMTVYIHAALLLQEPVLRVPPLLLMIYTALVTVLASLEARPTAAPATAAAAGSSADTPETSTMETEAGRRESQTPRSSRESPGLGPLLTRSLILLGGGGIALVPIVALAVLPQRLVSSILFVGLAVVLLVGTLGMLRLPTTDSVRRFVGLAIVCMALLDTGFVATVAASETFRPSSIGLTVFGGMAFSVPSRLEWAGLALVASMLLPAQGLRRLIRIT